MNKIGLYVHIPWCIKKCPYCDFNSHALKDQLPEARYINALLIGDETAISLGLNVKKLRLLLFITSALITSVLVANTGAIGFIGLMIPHICRFFVGGDIRRLLPLSALLGGLFLLWVDVLARTLLTPEELPIGIITGFIGGLFFIALLLTRSK
mgnify:CR=1 FL=1